MNYDLLRMIGLGNLDITYIFIGLIVFLLIILILVIIQMVKLSNMTKKYKKFMLGKNAKNLEKDIFGLYEDNKFIKSSIDKNEKDIRTLYRNLEKAFQKIGIVKYDAFAQMGGQLSFSLALLDENNNGFVLNSVHSTEGCYTYTKEIKHGECDIELGDEERQALNMAIGEDD
ncbi:MAG: DUF4446 family protein [Blautia sp.]|nr:DUF4446 family protein [Blautia sp.]MCM1199833.1 DUF4446 family protein [Bacteroides fragilis]